MMSSVVQRQQHGAVALGSAAAYVIVGDCGRVVNDNTTNSANTMVDVATTARGVEQGCHGFSATTAAATGSITGVTPGGEVAATTAVATTTVDDWINFS